jgi:radical SAM superfamily enzyme YgiQ (UPF0313 family)
MAQLGVESLDDKNLSKSLKTTNDNHIHETVKLMDSMRVRMSATYIVCFEDDTPESIRQAKIRLGNLGPIYTYFSILQPMPSTPQYHDMFERGLINDWNYRRWTGGYLVWKHPHIAPDEARELVQEMDRGINTPQFNVRLQREWKRINRMRERLQERQRNGMPVDMRARARVYYHPESHARLPPEEFAGSGVTAGSGGTVASGVTAASGITTAVTG